MPPAPTSASHEVLALAEANLATTRAAGFERLVLARDWALLHRADPEDVARNPLCARPLGASGIWVEDHVEAELAAALEVHPLSVRRLMEDALDLALRMPAVWSATARGGLDAWVARRIAVLTRALDSEQVAAVDAAIADILGTLPPGRLLSVVEARVAEADQAAADQRAAQAARTRGVWKGRDVVDGTQALFARLDAFDVARLDGAVEHLAHLLRAHCPELAEESLDQLRARALGLLANPAAALRLMIGAGEHDLPDVVADAVRRMPQGAVRPRATCYVHVTPETLEGRGVARAEELGVLTRRRLIDLLGHAHVTLKPVIDLNEEVAADCYEVPAALSERLHLARPADCFPYAQSVSRKQDQDHTVRYQWNGPPGQTRLSNLGHLVRRHHRIKTFGGWRVSQHLGRFTWITPHGRVYVTDGRGTHQARITPYASPLERRVADLVLAV